uniref:Putative capsid protein n=1 Tax=Circular ssDNA virus sp. TaxID=2805939 RepID=A0A894JP10_9VIRU|nr:putative capsid protein [Circular ssDNA virus sp.]
MIFINANIYGEMPYYSRYRRRTGFARYRRRYSGYRRRYYRRRTSAGGSLSSRSRLRIRVPAQRVVTLTIPAQSTDSDVATCNPFFEQLNDRPQCVCSAVGMPLYQAYTGLFDQVKCDGVITKVAVVSPIGSGATLQALQLLIAYDRQGTINETINSPAAVTVSNLYNMSSVQIRSAINNSVAKTARSCWASDIQERTVFHDCTIAVTQDKKVIYDQDYNSDRQVAMYFVPLTYIGIRNAAAAAESSTSVQILIEQVYYFTFRNPKFGAAPASGGGTKEFALPAGVRRAAAIAEDDPLATESLDSEERVFVRPRSGWTPPKKQPRSTVGAMMEAGLDDPEEVTPYLLESLAEREEAMDDPDYVGNPKGSMDRMKEDERVDLLVNLRKGKRQADRWHARHDGETTLLSPPHDTPRVVPRRKK